MFWLYTQNYRWQNRKECKREDELDTARLPQVYLRCKDCVSIKSTTARSWNFLNVSWGRKTGVHFFSSSGGLPSTLKFLPRSLILYYNEPPHIHEPLYCTIYISEYATTSPKHNEKTVKNGKTLILEIIIQIKLFLRF